MRAILEKARKRVVFTEEKKHSNNLIKKLKQTYNSVFIKHLKQQLVLSRIHLNISSYGN